MRDFMLAPDFDSASICSMSVGEGVAIAIGVSFLIAVGGELTRPKGSRWFSRGPKGENALLWDPQSAPKQ